MAIFFRKDLCTEVVKVNKDNGGNMLSLLIEFDSKKILLTGIYGPNSDDTEFYRSKIFNIIDEWVPEFVIYTGDWSLAFMVSVALCHYVPDHKKTPWKECEVAQPQLVAVCTREEQPLQL